MSGCVFTPLVSVINLLSLNLNVFHLLTECTLVTTGYLFKPWLIHLFQIKSRYPTGFVLWSFRSVVHNKEKVHQLSLTTGSAQSDMHSVSELITCSEYLWWKAHSHKTVPLHMPHLYVFIYVFIAVSWHSITQKARNDFHKMVSMILLQI